MIIFDMFFMNKDKMIEVFDSFFKPRAVILERELTDDFLDYCALNNLVAIDRRISGSPDPSLFFEHNSVGNRFLNEKGLCHYFDRAGSDEEFARSHSRTFRSEVNTVFYNDTFWGSSGEHVIDLVSELYFYHDDF